MGGENVCRKVFSASRSIEVCKLPTRTSVISEFLPDLLKSTDTPIWYEYSVGLTMQPMRESITRDVERKGKRWGMEKVGHYDLELGKKVLACSRSRAQVINACDLLPPN